MDAKMLLLVVVLCSVALQIRAENALTKNTFPFYQNTCHLCSTLYSGFHVSQAEITSITATLSNVLNVVPPCPPTESGDVQVVISSQSVGGGDGSAEVSAHCPANYIAINCRCSDESEDCSGVVLTSGGRGCTARSGQSGAVIRAIVTCVPDLGHYVVAGPSSIGLDPIVMCPPQTILVDCILENRSAATKLSTTRIVNNMCRVTSLCENSATLGCRVTAVCRRL